MIADGASREDVDFYLEEQGVEKWNAKKINQALDRQLRDRHKPMVRSYMEDQILDTKLDEFDDLDADTFEKLQYEVVAEMKSESRQKIRAMIAEEKSEAEILEAVQHQFFTEEEALAYLDQQNAEQSRNVSRKSQGIGLIVLGVLLSAGTMGMASGGMYVFTGLILWGVFILMKSD